MNTMRIVYPRYFPHVNPSCPEFPPMAVTRECNFPGLLVEILHLITRELHMKIEPITFGNAGETIDTDDMYNVLNYVHNATADTLAMGIVSTPERANNFTFSDILYRVKTRFIMRHSENIYTSMWSFFFIFDTRTWVTILSALIMQCCLCVIIRQTEVHMNDAKHIGVLESAWQMLRLQLLQPEKIFFKSKSGKMSIIFFSLVQCAVLLGVFSSWILSNILRGGHSVPADSIERLIDKISKREFHMVSTNLGGWFYEEINRSRTFPYPELRAAIQENPIRLTDSFNVSLKKISNGRSVVFVQDDSETYLHSRSYCGLVSMESDMPIVDVRLVFPRNTTLIKDVNRVIEQNKMLILRISRKYLQVLHQMVQPVCSTKHMAIGIVPYLGVFIVCLLIISTATMIFFVEIATGYNFNMYKVQPTVRRGSLNLVFR